MNSVEANRPKISDQARPEKIGSMMIGTAPSMAARGGQQDRPQPHHAALHDRVEQRAAAGQRQVDEVHQDDRIAGHDARQGDHADHARGREVDRIEIAAHVLGAERVQQPEAGHHAEDRQRNCQHDHHRNGERPHLGHEQNVAEEEGQREVFQPEDVLKENFDRAFAKIAARLPEVNRLNISFIRLPPSERNVSFVTCSRARAEYQFSETLLKSGAKAVAMALIDALAQTKSLSGKCDLDYENKLTEMVLECVGE